MKTTILITLSLIFYLHLSAADKNLKITAGWFWPKELKETSAKVKFAKSLGFNAMIWCSKKDHAEFIKECKKHKVTPFKIIEPLSLKFGNRMQVLSAEEKKINTAHKQHQSGGEPVGEKTDILKKKLICPTDKAIIENVTKEVKEAIALGYKGVCWDFIGYRNLKSCHCNICESKIKKLSNKKKVDVHHFYESQLIELYNHLQKTVKDIDDTITTTCHIHPVYSPNPFYASKIEIDYCAVTCSWFFQPHWKKNKIESYLKKTYAIKGGMPMLAYYQSGPLKDQSKSNKQIDIEFNLLQKYKGRSIMICELGSIHNQEYLIKNIKKLLK